MKSPYASRDPSQWQAVTERLLKQFPVLRIIYEQKPRQTG